MQHNDFGHGVKSTKLKKFPQVIFFLLYKSTEIQTKIVMKVKILKS